MLRKSPKQTSLHPHVLHWAVPMQRLRLAVAHLNQGTRYGKKKLQTVKIQPYTHTTSVLLIAAVIKINNVLDALIFQMRM